MKRQEAEGVLSGLAGFVTPMSGLATLLSLTDTAKHMGYRSVEHALLTLREQQYQRESGAPAEDSPEEN